MKDRIFGVLQRVGRSFMLPIAVLPVAGLLLGIGSSFTNATTIQTYGLEQILGDRTMLNALLVIMAKAGNVIFDNLPIIFAVGVAIGMAKAEKEVAALSAMIAFFVMHVSINAVLTITGKILPDGTIAPRSPGRNHCLCVRHPDLADGCVRGHHRRSGSGGAPQPLPQDCAAQCHFIFRRIPFCAIISNGGLCGGGYGDVFYMAGCAERHICLGGLVTGTGYAGTLIFRYYKEGAYSLWTSPCILYAVLADRCGRHHDGGRKSDSGRPEHFLRTAGFAGCDSFQRRCHQVIFPVSLSL